MPDATPADPLTTELAAWRATANAATEGPWRAEPDTGAGRVWVQIGRDAPWRGDADCEPLFRVRGGPSYAQREADAAFIVAARMAMPRLLAAVEDIHALTRSTDGEYLSGDSELPVGEFQAALAAALLPEGEDHA